ncbi:hypothetical protein CK203_075435 [Vitis vinifera]|uniref:Uncharacterized protein n=1 Tax=Vitis vinifera TaxID=29760 RepID=A0A438EUF9_VITVI|nr:hypothetical protein CK203_075435 [Vitis vinifera]
MCGDDDHLAWKRPRLFGDVQRVAYRRMSHILIPFFVLSQDWTFVLHLDIPSWDRVEEETFRIRFCSQPGYTFLGDRGQQGRPPVARDDAQYDPTVLPPPPPSQSTPQAMPFTLHSQTGVAPPPITVPTPTSKDPHACMDRLEQGLRQLRTSDKATTWEGFDGVPVASLPAKFRMPDIERYTGIGCPRLHLRLYSTVMRAHGLDEPQTITLFPLSLSERPSVGLHLWRPRGAAHGTTWPRSSYDSFRLTLS